MGNHMLTLARQKIYNTEMNDIRDCAAPNLLTRALIHQSLVQTEASGYQSGVIGNCFSLVRSTHYRWALRPPPNNRDDLSDGRDMPSEVPRTSRRTQER